MRAFLNEITARIFLIQTALQDMMIALINRGKPMDLIKLENDLYEIIFLLSDYLSVESQSYIKSDIIRTPLQTANDILFDFVEKLDLVIEQNDARKNAR